MRKKILFLFFAIFVLFLIFNLENNLNNSKSKIENKTLTPEEEILKIEKEINKMSDEQMAFIIDQYFSFYNLPLKGMGRIFVKEARKNDVFPLLLPAIGMAESTGGKSQHRRNNPFGFGKKNFASKKEAIAYVSYTLGGENPKLAYLYKDKNTYEKLIGYNSPERDTYIPKIIDIIQEMIYIYEKNNFS